MDVDVTLWRKSSFCASSECAEVARDGGEIVLRSSARPGLVRLSPAEWEAFLAGVRAGEFDDLAG